MHRAARLDRTYAVLQACVTLVSPEAAPHRDDRAAALWRLLTDLFATGANQDLVVSPATALTRAKLGATAQSPKLRAAWGSMGRQQKFLDMLKLAGLGA